MIKSEIPVVRTYLVRLFFIVREMKRPTIVGL
jgi:hypothetical protein